ncbi:DUF2202 domain-containing protein [Hydrogenimonas sp.]
MKTTQHLSFAAAILTAGILAGCGGGGSSDTTADTSGGTTTYDVTVERGPVLHAVVMDKKGNRAAEQGQGRYRFQNAPAYPIYAAGGYIDVDRDGSLSAGDIENNVVLLSNEGKVATVVSTVATRSDVRAWLKSEFGLSDEAIDEKTPDENRTVAAVSDEVYKHCVENNVSDPARLSLQEMQQLRDRIQARIQAYKTSGATHAELEEELIAELNLPVLTDENITALQSQGGQGMKGIVEAAERMPESNLTEEQKYTLAYMWNEEKLAKDIYLALDEIFPHDTFYNIATRSETQYEAAVEALVKKHDINITNLENYEVSYSEEELRALAPGEYAVPEVQALYDALYAEGSRSLTSALQVGCKVEVTDVADLDEDIEIAEGAPDLVMVYTALRSGSYNHYWAFDRALKSLGVEEGCCSLGEAYCKTPEEFPASSGGGNGSGHGPHDGTAGGFHGGMDR